MSDGPKILIVDDEPNIRDLLTTSLRFAGFAVRAVSNGAQAISAVLEEEPDLIILDVILPGLSGLKVCSGLKSNPLTKHIPVLVFSVLDVRDRALDAGADAFLLKPIERLRLIEAVRELLTDNDIVRSA